MEEGRKQREEALEAELAKFGVTRENLLAASKALLAKLQTKLKKTG